MTKIVPMHAICFLILPTEQKDVSIGWLLMMSKLGSVTENPKHLCFI